MKRLPLFLFGLLALCGCSATNITKFATAIGKDQATWKINVTTLYGGGTYVRLGAFPGQSCTVNSDGSITTTWTSPTNGFSVPVTGKVIINSKQ